MQPLLGAPRSALGEAAVRGLLQADPSVQVGYGCELLNSNLVFVADITDKMLPGSRITSNIYATIHRGCSLVLSSDAPVNFATDFVKPYMTLTSPETGVAARFNLGVYTLEDPDFNTALLPAELTVAGLDLLHFLDQPLGDSYEMAVGSDPVQVAADLIVAAVPGASVNYALSGVSTSGVYTWPFSDQTTYLSIVNDMMALVGYLGVWVDWDGVFRLEKYVSPAVRPTEWIFDVDADDNIVAADRTASKSYFNVPNWWRFTIANLDHAPVEGVDQITYVDTDPANPGSYANRGRYIKRVASVDAADYSALVAYAAVSIAADLSPAETFTVQTSPFPLAWHRDLISMNDSALASIPPTNSPGRRVLAREWEIVLDGSADMSWTWETTTVTTLP